MWKEKKRGEVHVDREVRSNRIKCAVETSQTKCAIEASQIKCDLPYEKGPFFHRVFNMGG